jgi:class 3 adenylate cyclase
MLQSPLEYGCHLRDMLLVQRERLFADVVHSMGIAGAVGAERLREIMAELVERASVVVQRLGGSVNKFTGDGIMAVR